MPGIDDTPELREAVCEVGRRLYQRGLCSGFDGNLSCRIGENRFLCTPTGVCKGFLKPGELCVVDQNGEQISGTSRRTSEILLHLEIFAGRGDVNAVVHSHPPMASAFAVTGKPLPPDVLAEAIYMLGTVPTAPYVTPGTMEFAKTVTRYMDGTSAILLANHGAVTFGRNIMEAWAMTESLENYARIVLAASQLGDLQPLQPNDVDRLIELRNSAILDMPSR